MADSGRRTVKTGGGATRPAAFHRFFSTPSAIRYPLFTA
jgi:hypothetical protein